MGMTTVTERPRRGAGEFEVLVRLEGGGEHAVSVADPLAGDARGERLLAWYFEENLRYPFLDKDRERAAVELLAVYGTELGAQLFGSDRECESEFRRARDVGFGGVCLELVGGVDFHRLHWEAMRDSSARGAALGAGVPIVRRVANIPDGFEVERGGVALNVLVVTARPKGAGDVGYRTISRPLLAALRQASVPVRVDLVRPGSWSALGRHLEATREARGLGCYQVLHFDVHGAVETADHPRGGETGYALDESASAPTGWDAFLFFETSEPT